MSTVKYLLVIFILFFIFLVISYPSFAEETCQSIGQSCTEGAATRNILGQPVYKPCWKYQTSYKCYEPEIDYCVLLKIAGCEQLDSTCTKTDSVDKKCNNYKNTYSCGRLQSEGAENITLLKSSYTVINDFLDYSKCAGREAVPNCSIVGSVCKQPAETRNINGKEIYKNCWQFENIYSCVAGGKINNCKDIPSHCQYQSSECLSQTGNLCVHNQKTYVCSKDSQSGPIQMQCESNVYCLNGQCQKIEENSPNDFAKSLAYLQAINQSKDNNGDASNLRIFTGNAKKCSSKAVGYNNCCSDQGWGQSIGASCSAEAKELSLLQKDKQCHSVGSYCSDKKPFGICLEITKTSCCFNSKISRIIIEQGRNQLGISWGSPESADCRGFTPEELQRLRFDQMDLREISADIADSTTPIGKEYLESKAREAMRRYEKKSSN